MRTAHQLHLLLFVLALLVYPDIVSGQRAGKAEKTAGKKLQEWISPLNNWRYPEKLTIDSIVVNEQEKRLDLWFPDQTIFNPVREDTYEILLNSIKSTLGKKFNGYSINLYSGKFPVKDLIPNYFRHDIPRDEGRVPVKAVERPCLIRQVNKPEPQSGLEGRYIALWHSHGYYFDMPLDRWEWQRAKLFGSVEDLSVMAYVVPYLVPMLENAGATVFLPRERDIQINEVIVDNDKSTGNSEFVLHISEPAVSAGKGFLLKDTIFTGENPFLMGTSLLIKDGSAVYIPDIPEKGYYGVTVSYPFVRDNPGKMLIRVAHTGGETDFVVDQSLGGGTWLWLGSFMFDEGKNPVNGSVTISGYEGAAVAVDAVRFGGGMGNVARRPALSVISDQLSLNHSMKSLYQGIRPDSNIYSWKLSGKPRYLEGSRYWLQYAGMPDTMVYSPYRGTSDSHGINDYKDDYMSRSEWVNYLLRERDTTALGGLGIPVDLSLAFHTDAGITQNDSIIGTLGIYSTDKDNGKFPDGSDRLASRDLTDIIQTQIVDDIRKLFNPDWTRRGMWDRVYYEARKPDVPAMLLELLSHQNLADQRFGFDPRFRFTVSRAVYKGMLRYLANATGTDYVVQPLPVSDMAIIPLGGKKIRLSWEPVNDPLEPTAAPSSYMVYFRTGDNGFNNGVAVPGTSIDLELPDYDTVYSFMVTAVNEGGESFPSEILAVGLSSVSDEKVLIVNGFDRISGPTWFDRDGMAGVAWWNDRGVADRYDFVTTGDQYDFERKSPWTDDDNAGWGASYSDNEGKVIAGNTFDFTAVHGNSVLAAGKSFFSVSDEVFNSEDFNLDPWCAVDLLFGEEKTTPSVCDTQKKDFQIYTPEFLRSLGRLKEASLPVFMSGAYPGTDLVMMNDTSAVAVVKNTLHFRPQTGHAVKSGRSYATDLAGPWLKGSFSFNTGESDKVYAAEFPDAIEPGDKQSLTVLRYTENNTSAAVIHQGKERTFVMGFPFETILSQTERDSLMKQILDFLLEER